MQNHLFDLMQCLIDFQHVERVINVPGTDRKENDTEHSYNLAIAAWIIILKDNLPLDIGKVLRYALVHDLVELYAGDSNALSASETATKAEREAAGLQRLEAHPVLGVLYPYIHAYENRSDEEAKFVYSLDKILPGLEIILSKQKTWIEHNISPQQWQAIFKEKATLSLYTQPYFEALIDTQAKHPELFLGHKD